MPLTLRRPAPIVDLAEMLESLMSSAPAGKLVGRREIAARYSALTRSWGAFSGPACLACGGLYAHDDGALEAWFACRPEASAAIGSIVRQARLTCRLIVETERVEIFARVAQGWEPGRRLARALGFRLTQAGAVERWSLCPT